MTAGSVIFSMFLIFTGAAVLATIALLARQSLLVAYIVLGGLAGPFGFALVTEASLIEAIGHIGIIFLLFLLGLNLHPQKLVRLLREASLVTAASAIVFATVGFLIALGFGFGPRESVVIGVVTMFSSTIIGLKLLPTTALHHRRVGEVIISVLLLQDIIAILILLALDVIGAGGADPKIAALRLLALPLVTATAFLLSRYVLGVLFARFDQIHEYVFLLAIGWCLGISQLGAWLGLSYEIGAFIAGVSLASGPISTFIAESLKPLRDFFLIMFFFSLGAGFAIDLLPAVAVPALVLAATMLVLKPVVFRILLIREQESPKLAAEIGARLGQGSEFALLIAVLALESQVIGERAASLIYAATVATFMVSSHLIMWRYPTPIAISARLRRD